MSKQHGPTKRLVCITASATTTRGNVATSVKLRGSFIWRSQEVGGEWDGEWKYGVRHCLTPTDPAVSVSQGPTADKQQMDDDLPRIPDSRRNAQRRRRRRTRRRKRKGLHPGRHRPASSVCIVLTDGGFVPEVCVCVEWGRGVDTCDRILSSLGALFLFCIYPFL